METKMYTPLSVTRFVTVALFLLFSGGATVVTLNNKGIIESIWTSSISWMWLPALFFLSISFFLRPKKTSRSELSNKR
jgi:hypothetical protein